MSLETLVSAESIRAAFTQQFGGEPTAIIRAPGRVNLIGEHTDYNDGFVMPMAIDRAVWVALRPRHDPYMVVHSVDYAALAEISLTEMVRQHHPGWAEYMKGVAWAMQEAGMPLQGWEGVVAGDVPRGAGLSSSAAIELATARALVYVSGLAWNPAQIALIAQRAENEWMGVKTGIMDQMISASGQAGSALLIDCRTLETQPVPLPDGLAVVVLDTSTRRGLVDSKYNERRAQCEQAAAHFGVKALRDVTLAQLEAAQGQLDPLVYRRARHVISENARTLAAADAMRAGDTAALGRLIDASHDSLRDDFEVTDADKDALNVIVNCARAHPACIGARMTGAGFGGCAVAIVWGGEAVAFAAAVGADYQAQTGFTPALYVTTPTAGASVLFNAD
ncbi:MAG: galactokinase [bacterium]|nr:galactokinase [bacterium]